MTAWSLPATERIDALFADWDRTDEPGCAIGIVRAGELAYARGYGMANLEHGIAIGEDSVFHVASISKQFAALALVLLERDGRLSLGDEVRRYLPELPDYGTPVTLRHLLNHTSGLRDQWELLALAGWRPDDLKTDGDVLDLAARQRELNFPVGAEWLYCNTGYTLAALVVPRVTGLSLRDFLHTRLFAPLGMARTHFQNDHNEIVPGRTQAYTPRERGEGWRISLPVFDTTGATSLFTTVEDLARWVGQLARWRESGDATLDALLTPGVLNDGTVLDYALGLRVGTYRGAQVVEHSGADAGYRAHFIWFPAEQLAVFVLCNRGDALASRRARSVADLCLWGESVAPEPEVRRGEEELRALSGLYRHPESGELRRLLMKDGRLIVNPGNVALVPLAGSRLRDESTALEYRVSGTTEGRSEFRVTDERGQATIYTEVALALPTSEQLREYAGTYHSTELDVTYTLVLREDQLLLCRRKFPDQPLEPADRDGFTADRYQLDFDRDAIGAVTGFGLTTGRIRRLRFEKAG